MSTIVSQLTPNRISRRTLLLLTAAVIAVAVALVATLAETSPAPTEPAVVLSESVTAPTLGSCHMPDAIVVAEGVTADALCNPPASTTAPATAPDTIDRDPAFPDTQLR